MNRPENFDPYFVSDSKKDKAKGITDDAIRGDHLKTEAMFRFAGTAGMVLSALAFVTFAIPVSSMLRNATEPDALFLGEEWRWRRWVARMVSVLTLAVVAAGVSWGLRWRRPWARWILIGLGVAPPLAVLILFGLTSMNFVKPAQFDIDGMTCSSAFVTPACVAALWAACSRRGRAVFRPEYDELIVKTPNLSPKSGVLRGSGLVLAMFILYWTITLMFLSILVARGVIRSI